jgi:predicted alternative tryptophan synthase beta-subunit
LILDCQGSGLQFQFLNGLIFLLVAGGLRYHGMAPLISHIYELGLMEAIAIPQTECFEGTFPNMMIFILETIAMRAL